MGVKPRTKFGKRLENCIEGEYRELGYVLGWRLLYSPECVLDSATICFIGINPGGSQREPKVDGLCTPPRTSAYCHERWRYHGKQREAGQSPLQRQIVDLFGCLSAEGCPSVEPTAVLAGNLIPFRSPSIGKLACRQKALDFGSTIWRSILDLTKPKLVIVMGSDTRKAVSEIVCARDGGGDFAFGKCRYGNYVGIKHLSRRLLKKTERDYLAKLK